MNSSFRSLEPGTVLRVVSNHEPTTNMELQLKAGNLVSIKALSASDEKVIPDGYIKVFHSMDTS